MGALQTALGYVTHIAIPAHYMDGYGNETSLNICKVDKLVTEHFSIQGRLDPRGTLCCFWCRTKTLNLSLCASDILTIIENVLGMRKFMLLTISLVLLLVYFVTTSSWHI
jgi:hypothetical protein